MADIELVIKIPEELISDIDDENYQNVVSWFDTTLYCAIRDGIPLPKGHGRIVDENKITSFGWNNTDNHAVVDAPTIIEADKAERTE